MAIELESPRERSPAQPLRHFKIEQKRGQLAIQQSLFLAGKNTAEDQDRPFNPGRTQFTTLLDQGYAKVHGPGSFESPRNRYGAMSVGIGLDDRKHLPLRSGEQAGLPEIMPNGGKVDFSSSWSLGQGHLPHSWQEVESL